MATCVYDGPVAGDQLGRDIARVLNRDRVAVGMNALLDLRLFGQDFDQDTAFELRICHWGILGRRSVNECVGAMLASWSLAFTCSELSMSLETLYLPSDGWPRCRWCAAAAGDEVYLRYHDTEWGFPVSDDKRLFEKLCLEGFQSGLSWRTILNKRESFRAAFAGFDFEQVARFGPAEVERLLQDAGIVRHRGQD